MVWFGDVAQGHTHINAKTSINKALPPPSPTPTRTRIHTPRPPRSPVCPRLWGRHENLRCAFSMRRLRCTGRLQPGSPLRITSCCSTRWSSSSCCGATKQEVGGRVRGGRPRGQGARQRPGACPGRDTSRQAARTQGLAAQSPPPPLLLFCAPPHLVLCLHQLPRVQVVPQALQVLRGQPVGRPLGG